MRDCKICSAQTLQRARTVKIKNFFVGDECDAACVRREGATRAVTEPCERSCSDGDFVLFSPIRNADADTLHFGSVLFHRGYQIVYQQLEADLAEPDEPREFFDSIA